MRAFWLCLLTACASCAAEGADVGARVAHGPMPGERHGRAADGTYALETAPVRAQASDASDPDADAVQAPAAPSTRDLTIVPHASWTCGMPGGIPPPELGTPAFTAELDVKANREVGVTQYGTRRLLELGAGKFSGPRLEATLTSGGFEVPLMLPNGAVELEQVLVLRGGRGGYIYLRVCGVAANATDPVRVVMDFEAPNGGPYASVNNAKLVGTRTLSPDGKKITLKVFDVTRVTPPAGKVVIENPPGLPDNTWECKTLSGRRGAEMYRETVGIGGSQSVGASKRGPRNIIPITGGTTTGKIPGKILPLGADFQLLGSSFIIDARYVAQTNDGALIIVRNCGPVGALVPVFEAAANGKYAFLNEDKWLSSDPSIGLGSVSLTIYEKR